MNFGLKGCCVKSGGIWYSVAVALCFVPVDTSQNVLPVRVEECGWEGAHLQGRVPSLSLKQRPGPVSAPACKGQIELAVCRVQELKFAFDTFGPDV